MTEATAAKPEAKDAKEAPPPPPKPKTAKEELAEKNPEAVSAAVVAATVEKMDEKQAKEILDRIAEASAVNPLDDFVNGLKKDLDEQVAKAIAAIRFLSATRGPLFDPAAGQLIALLLQLNPLPEEGKEGKEAKGTPNATARK